MGKSRTPEMGKYQNPGLGVVGTMHEKYNYPWWSTN
jgi:hypothetical protein